jgi:glycosyltransferase involved in cell wall biosynthesis
MVTYEYPPTAYGGAARQAQRLAEGLVVRGRRVGVVTARYPGSPAFERIAGVEVNRVWAIPKPGLYSLTFLPSLTRFLFHHGGGWDIWHAHQAFYNAGVALRAARLVGRRCVVKDASSGSYGDVARLRQALFGRWVRAELRRADMVISLNSEMTEELRSAGVSSARIRHIPNGVDCKQFAPASPDQRREARLNLGIGHDDVLVLNAGRLAVDTGTKFMLDAWRAIEQRFPSEPWTLIMAGDDCQTNTYRRQAGDLRRIRFVGQVADVRPLLRAADLLVRPSLNEGMSNVVLEAMASGLPIVGTRTGGLKEQIEDNVTGLLVTPGDSGALAEALLVLARDRQRRVEMGSVGRVRALERYSLESVLDAYEQLYDDSWPH